MKTKLLLALCAAITTLGQGVDVATATRSFSERKFLESVNITYGLDEATTNVTVTQLVLNVKVQRKEAAGPWVTAYNQPLVLSREFATSWVLSYTNNAGTVVTNNIRISVLSDCDRVDMLATRAVQLVKTPQAMAVPPPEVTE